MIQLQDSISLDVLDFLDACEGISQLAARRMFSS